MLIETASYMPVVSMAFTTASNPIHSTCWICRTSSSVLRKNCNVVHHIGNFLYVDSLSLNLKFSRGHRSTAAQSENRRPFPPMHAAMAHDRAAAQVPGWNAD